jgi:apolipoprotein N-acyltransferase
MAPEMAAKQRLLVIARAVAAGLCLAASVPPWGWWPLAFVGIALLDQLIAGQSWARRFRRTWLVAACWLFPAMFWMWDLTKPGYVVAGWLYAAYFATAAALCPPGRGRWIALPGAVLLAEVARWSFPFGGVPLGNLALSQAAAPLGQTARLLGAYLVVVVVVVGGIALSAAWERDWWVAGGIAVGLAALMGLAAIAPRGHDVSPLRVAIVQGGGPQRTRAADTDSREVFERHLQASEQIHTPVDLVVWPENVVAVEGHLEDSRENLELSALARRLHTTLVVGVTEGINDSQFFNAAVVYNPDGTRGDRYDKVRRVPFGEYVPLRGLIEKLAGSGAGLPARDAVAGTGPAIVHTPVGTLGTVISWEVFFADRARDAITHGGEVLLNPTNGSSYWLTILQTQQVASTRLRAIETGRWALQAAPTGFSAVITPDGGLVERTDVSERKVLEATITRRGGNTWATTVGPWPLLAIAVAALAAAWLIQRRTQPVPVPRTTSLGSLEGEEAADGS